MSDTHDQQRVVPCEPTWQQVLAGAKKLDAWNDDAIADVVDDCEMARRIYRAMVGAADPEAQQ